MTSFVQYNKLRFSFQINSNSALIITLMSLVINLASLHTANCTYSVCWATNNCYLSCNTQPPNWLTDWQPPDSSGMGCWLCCQSAVRQRDSSQAHLPACQSHLKKMSWILKFGLEWTSVLIANKYSQPLQLHQWQLLFVVLHRQVYLYIYVP